jgi:hypothetical protein
VRTLISAGVESFESAFNNDIVFALTTVLPIANMSRADEIIFRRVIFIFYLLTIVYKIKMDDH